MYSISSTRYINKGRLLDKMELMDIDGFLMPAKKKVFKINDSNIKDIKVVNKNLASPIVTKKVLKKYDKLLNRLTDLIVEDDDSGTSCREALNQIEKLRLEIKNKYRSYLKQKELEKMSKQLTALQKAAKQKMIEIEKNKYELQTTNNRSR